MPLLTKSQYLDGLQCLRYLWRHFNEPEKIPELDLNAKFKIKQGYEVGKIAKELFPEGINIPTDNFKKNFEKTKELLNQNKPLFEAGFIFNNCFSRADILLPVGDEWDIIEVKSSTKVKDINIHDVSFQKYCYENSGLKIRKCFLIYVNNDYVKNGEINPEQFLIKEEITSQVNEAMKGVKERIDLMFKIISSKECPDISITNIKDGSHNCSSQGCFDTIPENNVFTLYNGRNQPYELYKQGILTIKDIPDNFELNPKQRIQVDCEKRKEIHIDNLKIKNFLSKLKYPLYFLDFETFNPAVPMFDGTKPYQWVPFQFSLHIVKSEGAEPKHYSFLVSSKEDPRKEFISELKKVLGDDGTILVYNQVFEKKVLRELAESFPEYRNWIENILEKVIDLWLPFRSFHYYNPLQKGSASIKYVLPAMTGDSYGNLEIGDGETASASFLNITFNNISEEERFKVRKDLEKYCKLDTEGMVWIVDKLNNLI